MPAIQWDAYRSQWFAVVNGQRVDLGRYLDDAYDALTALLNDTNETTIELPNA